MKSLKEFIKKIQSDEKLTNEFSMLAEKEDKTDLIEFMKKYGVTEDDLADMEKQQEEYESTGELSEDMLDMVSGGGCWSKIGGTCVAWHNTGSDVCSLAHSSRVCAFDYAADDGSGGLGKFCLLAHLK